MRTIVTMGITDTKDSRLLENTFRLLSEEIDNRRSESEIVEACSQFFTSTTYRDKAKLLVAPKRKCSCTLWICATFCTAFLSICVAYFAGEDSLGERTCLAEHSEITEEFLRPMFDCSLCEGLTSIPTVENITTEEFVAKYGYSTVPLIVTGVAKEWKALEVISYDYFKNLYSEDPDGFKVQEDCDFFSYDGRFDELQEVFEMTEDQVNMTDGQQWYVGWCNCHKEVSKKLRQLFQIPHFIPKDSASMDVEWIFMGGQGKGAVIHIDDVGLPSWQAQISGSKTWTLYPAAECAHVCHQIQAQINPGDIIFVDTNRWFHSTFIHPGNLSITIGTEYT